MSDINSNLVFVQNSDTLPRLLVTRERILNCGCTGDHRAQHARELNEVNLELTVTRWVGADPSLAPELAARLGYVR